MPQQSRIVSPGKSERSVTTDQGQILDVPEGWSLLPPGDAGLTRRVKATGPTWTVQEKRGRKTFSKGVWADSQTIEKIRADLNSERATPTYQKRRKSDERRREKQQVEFVASFYTAVVQFLNFDQEYHKLAEHFAKLVTEHAAPVGSGTVARTKRISVEQRAESAVIAWMRHQTTSYDNLKIARVKGRRREVRRELAEHSRKLLQRYRNGEEISADCPLQLALKS